ncbi:MAG: Flp pilus assembly protein CpaB [Terriglobales bacterium]
MHQRRLLAIGAAALVISGLLTVFTYRSFVKKAAGSRPNTTTIMVATKDLPVGMMVGASDVRAVEMPSQDLPLNVVTDEKKVVGRGVIAPMVKNEIVLDSKLAADKAGAGLPAMIPPNMRAVSVQVNEVIAVAGFVVPGTRVDVLLTGSPSRAGAASNQDVMTTTVLENVEVLAAGQKIEANAEGKPDKVPVITLLVSPQDAQKLTLASAEGRIQLSLRNPLDEHKSDVAPVQNAALYHAAAPVAAVAAPKAHAVKKASAAPPAPPVYALEVIRGDKRDVTKF